LLQNGSAHASRASDDHGVDASATIHPASHLDSVVLPSHLVAYQSPTTTTLPTAVREPVTEATHESPAVVTPITVARPVIVNNSEHGQATWYAAAPPGKCASPTLPFGTVLTVTNDANGRTTVCTVDDREEAGYPRVVDLSPSGFSQLESPSEGVADVTISW
jgi:rare lipoprotein A (peptidoglycan hydrolase)